MKHAFDMAAQSYDGRLGARTNMVSAWLRRRWHEILVTSLPAAGRIADVGCGTGDDTLFLARRGYLVTAVDPSFAMLAVARHKINGAGCENRVHFVQASAAEWAQKYAVRRSNREPYQAIVSGFGALSAEPDLQRLRVAFAELLDSHGVVCAMPMGRISPWHFVAPWKAGGVQTVLSRVVRGRATARIGTETLNIRYFFPSEFIQLFSPEFVPIHVEQMGFFMPPPEMFTKPGRILETCTHLLAQLERQYTGPKWGADHICFVLEKQTC